VKREEYLIMKTINKNTVVICPVYNEEDTLNEFYYNLRNYYNGDVIFINDGSTDNSGVYLKNIIDEKCVVIEHFGRKGYGAAIITGFNRALCNGYESFITIDADLQHDPKHIASFVEALSKYDVVLGSRYLNDGLLKHNVPEHRFIINRYIRDVLHKVFGYEFSDPFCGLRGYRASFLKKIDFIDKSYGIALEFLLEIVKNSAEYIEIPVKGIYLNNYRVFWDGLNNPRERLIYYLNVITNKRKTMRLKK
jgi:glycosyltransferase involved in cell wall biosynthesis